MKGVPASTYFSPHLRQLRLCGYVCMPQDDNNAAYSVLHKFVFVALPIFLIQVALFTLSVKHDPEKFVRSLIIFFTLLPTFGKMLVLRFNEDKILNIISKFNDPLCNRANKVHEMILNNSAIHAERLLKTYHTLAMITCVVWTIYPIIEFAYTGETSLDCEFGFNYNRNPHFFVALFYVKGMTVILATGNSGTDCLISAILGQCKTQLTLLRLNFENLYENSLEKSIKNKEHLHVVLNKELVDCIDHFEKISRIINEHGDIFGLAIFFQLSTSGWIICVVAYRIVIINAFNLELVTMCMFMLLVITEFFVYCFYGNEVKYESEQLINSVYKMNWQETPISFQKNLLIPMEKFKVPIAPTAMKILPLTLETFVKILQSSYTFYAVLKSTTH